MGLLRAIADVVIIGSGTLSTDRTHVWTAELANAQNAYVRLVKSRGKRGRL